MAENPLQRVHTLTFDVFGTVLDLTDSIVGVLREFLKAKGQPTIYGRPGGAASASSSSRIRCCF